MSDKGKEDINNGDAESKSIAAEYKANQRAKSKAIKDGTYQPSLFEQAKKEIVETYDLNLGNLMQIEQYHQGLSDEDLKKMKEFIKSIRKKTKRIEEKKLTEEKAGSNDQIQTDRHLIISDELCAVFSNAEKKQVLINHNTQNPSDFFEYLKGLIGHPVKDFLSILVEVVDHEQHNKQKLRIFLSICGLYRGEALDIDIELCAPMLEYIAFEEEVTDNQALGFLRLVFSNEIGLEACPMDVLNEFDRRYKYIFPSLYSFFQNNQYQISGELISVLPQTCFIMLTSTIKFLKQKPNPFAFVPSEFLRLVVEVLVYSLDSDIKSFKEILSNLQTQFIDQIERIKSTNFIHLLQLLVDKLINQDPLWFKRLVEIKELFNGALAMIKENKIKRFDMIINTSLLSKQKSINDYLQQPSLIRNL